MPIISKEGEIIIFPRLNHFDHRFQSAAPLNLLVFICYPFWGMEQGREMGG